MRRLLILAAIALAPLAARAQPAPPPDPTTQAMGQTISDLTQAWVATRAQLLAAQAKVAELTDELAKAKADKHP